MAKDLTKRRTSNKLHIFLRSAKDDVELIYAKRERNNK